MEDVPGLQECTWRVDDIIPGYVLTSFDLTFYDIAMNKFTESKEVEIYGVADQAPNFWSVKVTHQMPSALDRSTSEVINHIMAYHLELAGAQNAELLSSGLLGCEGDVEFLESTGKDLLINNGPDNKDPYLLFTFKKFDSENVDSINIACTFETKTLYNKVFYPAEQDTINLTIKLFNTALGEASESTNEQIEELKDTYIRGWWRFIGGLNTMFRYAKGACLVVNSFRQVVGIWNNIKLVWSTTQKVSAGMGNIPGAAAANSKRILACNTVEKLKSSADRSWEDTFNKLCGFVNCKLGPMPEGEEGTKTKLTEKLSILGGRGRFCGPITDTLGGDWIKTWTGKSAFGDFNLILQ